MAICVLSILTLMYLPEQEHSTSGLLPITISEEL